MTIELELKAEVIERLSSEAKARGIGLEEYAETLLRQAMSLSSAPRKLLSVDDLHTMLAAMAQDAERLPKLATSAFSRESFYDERR
jgi:hypothetical protein